MLADIFGLFKKVLQSQYSVLRHAKNPIYFYFEYCHIWIVFVILFFLFTFLFSFAFNFTILQNYSCALSYLFLWSITLVSAAYSELNLGDGDII